MALNGTTSQSKAKYTVYIKGYPTLNNPGNSAENLDVLLNHEPRDGDIILSSHMRTGSHWLCFIIKQILNRGLPCDDSELDNIAPFLGKLTTEELAALKKPRFYRHHRPHDMVRNNDKAKYFYVYRNPCDTVVSAYHYLCDVYEQPFLFEDVFEDFLKGDSYPFGSYFEHVLSFVSHKEDKNLFITSYEKIKKNKMKEILRVAKFLGEEYFKDITSDESYLKRVMDHTDFKYMKANFKTETGRETETGFNFFRKGIVGDGQESLTPQQKECLRKAGEEYLKGTDVYIEWYSTP